MHYLISAAETHASTDETRDYLRYVRVDASRVWAADGHRICVLHNSCALEPGDYLNGLRIAGAPEGPPFEKLFPPFDAPVLLTLDRGILATLWDLHECIGKRTIVTVEADGPDAACPYFTIVLCVSKGSGRKEKQFKSTLRMDGQNAVRPFGINLGYLLDAIDVACTESDAIVLRQVEDLGGILIAGSNGQAVVMPTRV